MCLVAWYLFFEICRLFLCLRYNQNLIFFCAFHIIRIYKKFLFRGCCIITSKSRLCCFVFFAVVLSFYKKRICGWFGRNCRLRYFNIQKTFHFVVIVCYVLFWERFWLSGCVDCLLWLFLWLILRLIDEIVCRVCFDGLFERVFDWMVAGIVFSDCLIWLIVPVGCFLLNGCDFVRKKKNYGRTVHCNVAFVKPYVKMSALWFKRLIFWFGRVLFVVKTFSCSERRFASGTS